MTDLYGGGIPFSSILNENKTKRISRRTRRKKRTRTRKIRRPQVKGMSMKKCNCKINKNLDSPEGLGFCPKCQPLNVIMRGKDDNLWKIEKINNSNKWVKVN